MDSEKLCCVPGCKLPHRTGQCSKNLNKTETTQSDVVPQAETQAEAPLTFEDPLMADQEYTMDIEITTDEVDHVDQHVEDHYGAEAGKDGIQDHNVSGDSDDYHSSDDQGDSDDQSDDGLPAQASSSTKTAKLTTSQPAAKQIIILPKPTTNLLTAKSTKLLTATPTTPRLTPKPITNLLAAKAITNIFTAQHITNQPTAKLITNQSATTPTKNLSTAKHIIHLPTTKFIKILPKSSTSLSIDKPSANLTTDKPITKPTTAKTTTNLSTVKLAAKTEIQPEFKTPAKDSVIDPLKKTYGNDTPKSPHQYGYCRCCLTKGVHSVANVCEVLECLNIEPSADPRLSVQVCAECSKFLQQARKFRDMVAATEKIMLGAVNSFTPEKEIKIPLTSLNSHAEIVQGGAKKRRVVVLNKFHETEASEECIEDDEKERGQEEGDDFGESGCDLETAGEVTVPMEETADGTPMEDTADGTMLEDRPFSQFSEYSDFGTDTKDDTETLNDEDYYKTVKSMKSDRTKLASLIRANLVTLLECSTIVPFQSTKGILYECIYCDSSYPRIDELKLHMEEKHINKNDDSKHEILRIIPQSIVRVDISCIKCRLCDEQFESIDNLVKHLVDKHNKKYHDITTDPPHNVICFDLSLKDWKCLTCEKIFPTFKKLRIHVNQHYGSFLCHQCGTKFLYPNTYSKHMQDHQKIKQDKKHMCDTCGDTFRTKKDLTYHTNRAHYDDSLVKRKGRHPVPLDASLDENGVYECNLCTDGTTFTSKFAAYAHRIEHLNNTRDGPFDCDQCKYSSPKKSNTRNHLQVHYNIRRFVCEVCNKRFVKKTKLTDHMHMHLNLRFQCPLCDSTLSNREHVKRHVKNKHPGVTVDFS